MQTPETPVVRDIVLVGGGHSHAVLLRRWAMRPLPGVRLTLICRDTHTPYSGMLPGHIAGHYSFEQVHIDLRTLAQAAGARFFRKDTKLLQILAEKKMSMTCVNGLKMHRRFPKQYPYSHSSQQHCVLSLRRAVYTKVLFA
jgi:hypothetical protein